MPYSVTAPDGRKVVVGDDGAPLQDTPQNRGLYGDLSQFGGGASYAKPGDTFDPSKSYYTGPGFPTASIPTPSAPSPTYAIGGGSAAMPGTDGRRPAVLPLSAPVAAAPAAPAAPAAAAPAAAAPAAPAAPAAHAATAGVYAPPDYTGGDTGTYGQWLKELHGYAAPANGTVGAGASPTDQLNAMLAATHADHYLSPYYVAMLRAGIGKAGAGYALSAALQPGSPDMPTEDGTGATESLGQYMQDQLIQRGNQGLGTSGWGPYASGVPLLGAFVTALTNAANAPAGSPQAALWAKYNATTAGRQQLQNILGAGVEGPFQAYRQGTLNDDVFNPASDGVDNAAFIQHLHDWAHATYGV